MYFYAYEINILSYCAGNYQNETNICLIIYYALCIAANFIISIEMKR